MDFFLTCAPPELRRCQVKPALERHPELAGAGVADRFGDLHDRKAAVAEQFGCFLHAALEQILVQRAAVKLAEAVFERGGGDVKARGKLRDGEWFGQV